MDWRRLGGSYHSECLMWIAEEWLGVAEWATSEFPSGRTALANRTGTIPKPGVDDQGPRFVVSSAPRPEVLEIAARSGSPLSLILGTDVPCPVRLVGRRRHSKEADLPNFHAGIESDRQGRDVG